MNKSAISMRVYLKKHTHNIVFNLYPNEAKLNGRLFASG